MTERLRVFVNDRPFDLPAGSDALAAVRAFDPEAERDLMGGTAYLTDGCGIAVSPDSPLAVGAILRLVHSGRKTRDADARDS